MNQGFWSNKPVKICNNISSSDLVICSKEDILINVNKEIQENRFKLDYSILEGNNLTSNKIHNIVEFINMNYVESKCDSFKLIYTDELFSFYCKDSIILEFYPENNKKIVGYVLGKKTTISLYNSIFDTSEVNFLCIIPNLRSLGLSSYMLNVLTKEIILKYNVTTSHYTISAPIKSPYFGEKRFYHRFINTDNLYKIKFISSINNVYNTFNYNKQYHYHYKLKYINGHGINDDLGTSLYDKYISYCKSTYDIYDIVDYQEFNKSFSNNMFHHFIIYSESEEIVSYVSLFRLDTFNNNIKISVKAGYYYYMFFEDKSKIINDLEYINKYIYDNSIFDILTFSDIFDIDYENTNCIIKGSSILRYYFYNMKIPCIINCRNGMITI